MKIFGMSSKISRLVKQSYIEFQISKRGVIYMVGNLKKLSTSLIQITCPDSIVRFNKNRTQPNCSRFLDCAELQLKTAISVKRD